MNTANTMIIAIIARSLCFIFITVISVRLYFAVRQHANQIKLYK